MKSIAAMIFDENEWEISVELYWFQGKSTMLPNVLILAETAKWHRASSE